MLIHEETNNAVSDSLRSMLWMIEKHAPRYMRIGHFEKKRTEIRAEQVDEMMDMLRETGKLGPVAKHFGVDSTSVAYHAKRRGVPFARASYGKITPEKLDIILRRRQEGCAWGKISEEVGVTRSAVQRAVMKHNLKNQKQ